jgi:multidrug resistance protein, MATE family
MREAIVLAYPIIFGQLGVILMGVADTIMVGRLGSDVLASANQANNIFFMVSGITFGVLFAVSTLVSIKVGEGRAADGFITYRAGLAVAVILFAFQYAILEIIAANFNWLGQDAVVVSMAPGYLRILNLGILPMLIMIAARQYTDGLGYTKIAMVITIAGLALNVLLNYLLIYGNFGFPAMGLQGAAWATLISRVAMALAVLWYIRYSTHIAQYRPHKMPSFKTVMAELPEIWAVGLPIALQTFAEWACFSISGIMVGWLGAERLAAHAVALNVASVTYMIVSGIAIAGSIMVGNAYGETNADKIKRVSYAILWIIVVFEVFNALVFLIFSKSIANLYGATADVAIYVLPLLMIAAVFQLADGIQAGAMNLLRGVKDVNWASAISVLSYWIISLPLSYFLGIVMGWDVYGIWFGFTIGLFLAAIFGVWRFYLKQKTLKFEFLYEK